MGSIRLESVQPLRSVCRRFRGRGCSGTRQIAGLDCWWHRTEVDRDGKELFYLAGSILSSVDLKTSGAAFEAGISKPVFELRSSGFGRNRYVVTRVDSVKDFHEHAAPSNLLRR